MNIRTLAVTCLLLAGQPHAHAGDAGASEASIRELLVLTDSESMIDNLWAQVEAMMESASKQALAGRPVTEAQQVSLDDMHMEMLALLREELSWPVYEPMMIDIFRSTFTEEELQGIISGETKAPNEMEQAVFDYARAASEDAPNVPREILDRLKKHLTPPQIVELACVVGFWKFYNTVHDSLHIPIEQHLLADTGYVSLA